MKKTVFKITKALSFTLAVVLAASVFVSPFTVKTVGAANADVKKYQDKISSLKEQEKELKNKIYGKEKEMAETASKKQYLDSLVSTVGMRIQAAESLITELDNQITESDNQIKEYEKQINETKEKIKERMLISQQTGKESYLDVLIGAEGIGDFLSRLERLSNVLQYDRENLAKYQEAKTNMEQQKKELEDSKKLQEQTLKTLEADKAESEELSRQAESYWNDLQSDKEAYQAEYQAAKAAENALDNELQALLASITAQHSSEVVSDGNFMWPLPSGGYISCYYGDSDPKGDPHYAVDCAIRSGTPIYASNDGSVVRAQWHYSYGNYILLDHGNGYSTLYAHCSSLAVSSGQTVAKGQVIGYVGSTGYSFGAHLHFEFRVNGSRVNALNYMSKR